MKYFCLFVIFSCYSQDINFRHDSLLNKLHHTTNVENKIKLYYDLSQEIEHTDIIKSKLYSNSILDLSKKYHSQKGIALYYNSQASISYKENKFEKALTASNKAEQIFLSRSDTLHYLKNLRTKARVLNELNQPKEEYKCLVKGYNIAVETNYFTEIADISFLLASDFTYLNINQSFNYLNKAIYNFKLGKDSVGLAGCYYLLASIYYDSGQFNKQIEYLKKCEGLVNEIEDRKIFLLYCYREYTSAYIKQKKYEQAIQMAKSAIQINKKFGFGYDITYEYINLSEIYLEQKKYSLAIKYLNKAQHSNPVKESTFLIYKNLGNIYYRLGNFEIAKKNQIEAIRLLDSINAKSTYEIFNEYATTLYALKDYSNAFINLKKYSELNNNFLNKEKESRLNLLQIQFDVDEKEAELKKIKLGKIQNEKQLQLVNKLNYFLLSIIVLGITVFFIAFVSLISNRRKNKLLLKKNQIINYKIDELEESNLKINNLLIVKNSLLKEIHHRVKNNLQLIMSLLNLQSRDQQKTSVQDFLDTVRSRISTMSIIHQNLYQTENFNFINFQEFLENLTLNIKETFGNENIEFDINTNDNNFDLDTATPLGLIINELVSNAFKYAFKEGFRGEIHIEIVKEDDGIYKLFIGDNGIGYSKGRTDTKSIGLELVSLLVLQLRGKIEKLDTKGTNYSIDFRQVFE